MHGLWAQVGEDQPGFWHGSLEVGDHSLKWELGRMSMLRGGEDGDCWVWFRNKLSLKCLGDGKNDNTNYVWANSLPEARPSARHQEHSAEHGNPSLGGTLKSICPWMSVTPEEPWQRESLGNIQTSLEANVFSSTTSASKISLETFKSTVEMGAYFLFLWAPRWTENHGRSRENFSAVWSWWNPEPLLVLVYLSNEE